MVNPSQLGGVLPVGNAASKTEAGKKLTAGALSFGQDLPDVRVEAGLAPIQTGGPLRELRFVDARRLEQGPSGCPFEPGIIPLGKVVVAPRHLALPPH